MPTYALPLTAGTGSSTVVDRCQVCGSDALDAAMFFGFLPPVNQMRAIGEAPHEQPAYPANLLVCDACKLVQIGLVVDPGILFPPDYPYTSGTTRILHENFADLAADCAAHYGIGPDDLVVDVGSNDGTLLSKFKERGHKVFGIEPTDAGDIAVRAGIETMKAFFTPDSAARARDEKGAASIVTACNCFAHIEDVHAIVEAVLALLKPDGLFVSESHYLVDLLSTVQYDTVYHEHLRYYSLESLSNLLAMHGLEVVRVKRIPSHGGSIRVYAARKGEHGVDASVGEVRAMEAARGPVRDQLAAFRERVVRSKTALIAMLDGIKARGQSVVGISAPSRASTLANYVGLDDGLLDAILEVPGSLKIGKCLPGTLIPVIDESYLFDKQPDYALILAWHIADELAPKLKAKGYTGRFIVPLPEPRVID